MGELVFAAIAPHGGIAVPEAVAPPQLAASTAAALGELGRRHAAAAPDATIVLTPHGVHVRRHFAVVVAGRMAGSLEGSREPVRLDVETDRALAEALLSEIGAFGLPAVGVSYGGNDEATAVMPMDWAVLIPLWFMRTGRVVAVSPSRDHSGPDHVAAGRAVARAVAAAPGRVALIASADHGHAHDAAGPYGFDPAAADYDARTMDIISSGRLERLLDFDPGLVTAARADSWWQLLMLAGAVEGRLAGVELLSYEAPTYFGMACAELRLLGQPDRR